MLWEWVGHTDFGNIFLWAEEYNLVNEFNFSGRFTIQIMYGGGHTSLCCQYPCKEGWNKNKRGPLDCKSHGLFLYAHLFLEIIHRCTLPCIRPWQQSCLPATLPQTHIGCPPLEVHLFYAPSCPVARIKLEVACKWVEREDFANLEESWFFSFKSSVRSAAHVCVGQFLWVYF